MGTLFVVGTPIGNLEDISVRALNVLRSVKLIACEDTRVTSKLLKRYDITTSMTPLHQHSPQSEMNRILDRVKSGDDVALVTDAGMPGIADPGGILVEQAHQQNLKVQVIPGASAVTAALGLAGLPADRFIFLGFLPHKKGRQTLFERIADMDETVVLYESPHRLTKTLDVLAERMPERIIAVTRELTKMYESIVRGPAKTVQEYFQQHPDEVRGEIVIVIGAKK